MKTSHSYSPKQLAELIIARLEHDPEETSAEDIRSEAVGHIWNEICDFEEAIETSLDQDMCEKAVELIEFVPARWVLKVKEGGK